MTMLDRMRRHKNWLKWSLALVVLAFIVFYIPEFLGRGNQPGSGSSDSVAVVAGQPVTVAEFRKAYNQQLQAYRGAYGGAMNEQLLRQLGIDRQILQQLIDERAAVAEAERLGLTATDAEVGERILRIPAFQENGQFIGETRYRQILQMQNPPLSVPEFEENVRRSVLLEKLRAAVTDWMTVSDAEVEREFRRRNEQVKLAVVALPVDKFREGLTASDQEIAAYFDSHKEEFRIGEKRKVRFFVVDVQKLRETAVVTPQDVERAYNTGIEQYTTPEQVRASHILFKTEGKDEAAVRATAEKVLAEVKAGGDFAVLAGKYSEDEASKGKGGDLDYFSRGQMVPEFDQVAFTLPPGQVSDLVKTQFGFHIIKVTEKKAATVRPIDEVRPQIADQLKWERAQAQLTDLAARLQSEIKTPADLDKAAAQQGIKVQESGFFQRDEPITGIGPAPEAAAEAFTLKEGEVSGAIRIPQGIAFLTVTGKQDARLAKLDEVKDKVREAVTRQKGLDAARARAGELAATLKSASDFTAAAKAGGYEAKTTELIARGAALPDVGASPAVENLAFSLPAGAVSDPIVATNAAVIVKVLERKDVTAEELAAGKAALRDEMLQERRGRFFSAYMVKAKQRMKIDINREVLAKLMA
jgi:peptidyl-prolyl cis-trans isomerase D